MELLQGLAKVGELYTAGLLMTTKNKWWGKCVVLVFVAERRLTLARPFKAGNSRRVL